MVGVITDMSLFQKIAIAVEGWRKEEYSHSEFPVMAEILEWARNPLGAGFRLRKAQIIALETYWYLRLVLGTPHVLDLYTTLFSAKSELLEALGLDHDDLKSYVLDHGIESLFEAIREENDFASKYKLDTLQETMLLEYPSYIFALAMGAGKTVLIGAIIATEFIMAMEYPENKFVRNALVFAPGKTILESLRELVQIPFSRIIPPRLCKRFEASLKIHFTRDREKHIPVPAGSYYNVIVTNTEKIRIRKESVRRGDISTLAPFLEEERAKVLFANARLESIASLPNLAVFSDEAHHTYGRRLGAELKRVRETVNYLAKSTDVICVVNTTGTPYFKKQPLRDVVVWYGLSEGISDGILKEVADNIYAFSFDNDVEAYVEYVIEDFFRDYGNVTLPDGTPAKLALYFPQTDDVEEIRPFIETKLSTLGLPHTLIVEHHTSNENKEDFNRFRSRDSPHRIALLVNRGVEGWDVPSLFACALVRKLKSSNNFVLQAASRCLRQIPGNRVKARIYLSMENQSTLDKELQETYGESIEILNRTVNKNRRVTIHVRKTDVPPLVVKRKVRRVVRKESSMRQFVLTRPKEVPHPRMTRTVYTILERNSTKQLLHEVEDTIEITSLLESISIYRVAVELSAFYHIDTMELLIELRNAYGELTHIPLNEIGGLVEQIERATCKYEMMEEVRDISLALVKLEGFEFSRNTDGVEMYTAEISYPADKEKLLARWEDWKDKADGYGFHYTPYNFDSNPEKSFFESMLDELKIKATLVEDIYFTGALIDPRKTDFYVEYKGQDGLWHRYSPDFIIKRKDGKCLIVEIKDARFEAATLHDLERDATGEKPLTQEGRKAIAIRKWEKLNPELLKYEMIFVSEESIAYNQLKHARRFLEESEK